MTNRNPHRKYRWGFVLRFLERMTLEKCGHRLEPLLGKGTFQTVGFGEGQDVTVYPMEDGTLIHALDIGALFMDSNLRHYKWAE
jgi:hypothetical protein